MLPGLGWINVSKELAPLFWVAVGGILQDSPSVPHRSRIWSLLKAFQL